MVFPSCLYAIFVIYFASVYYVILTPKTQTQIIDIRTNNGQIKKLLFYTNLVLSFYFLEKGLLSTLIKD